MPGNQPIGNNPALVELDAQISEVNRALSAIRINQASDFGLIVEGLSAILENRELPDSISDDAMKAGLNTIQDFFAEPCQWVRDQANKQAFYELAKRIIRERMEQYRLLAQTDQREAAERYIQAENDRRAEAQLAQERLQNAPAPRANARTLGLSEDAFVLHQFRNQPRPHNLIEVLGLSGNTRSVLIVMGVVMTIALVATAFLSIMFATWIGGSILSDAGWKGVLSARQLVAFSMSVAGIDALLNSAWLIYKRHQGQDRTEVVFLGYRGYKGEALRASVFFMAASLMVPLFNGVMNGSVYGFTLASAAIGFPLAMAGFYVAAYFIVVNVAALFAPPIVALELRSDNLDNAAQGIPQPLVINPQPDIMPALESIPASVPVPASVAATGAPLLLTQSIPPQPQVQQEDRPLTLEELRNKRLAYLENKSKQEAQHASEAVSSTSQSQALNMRRQ